MSEAALEETVAVETLQPKADISYKDLLKETNYMKETTATVVTRLGDGIDTIAMSLLVYSVTNSPLLVALSYAVNGLPNLIFGLCSGVLCKYFSEKKIMVVCDFGRALCVLAMMLLYVTGNINVISIFAITFLISSFESFREPAGMSITPQILSKDKMEKGIALSSTASKVATLVGLAGAGVVVGILGIAGAMIIDIVTFIVCGLLIMSLKLPKEEKAIAEELTAKTAMKDLKDGFKYVLGVKMVRSLCLLALVVNAIVVPLNSLQAPYVSEVLRMGDNAGNAISVIGIGLMLGMSVGAIIGQKLYSKLKGKKLMILGGIVISIPYCLLVLLGGVNTYVTLVLLLLDVFVMGIGVTFVSYAVQLAMMTSVKEEYLARAASVFNALGLCASPIASCIVGAMAGFLPLEIIFMGSGILCLIVFIAQILNRSIDEI